MSNGTITAIAQKHNKSVSHRFRHFYRLTICFLAAAAQVLLRWATQRGIAVIPKSNNIQRNIENMRCDTFNLEEEDITAISSLNKHQRV